MKKEIVYSDFDYKDKKDMIEKINSSLVSMNGNDNEYIFRVIKDSYVLVVRPKVFFYNDISFIEEVLAIYPDNIIFEIDFKLKHLTEYEKHLVNDVITSLKLKFYNDLQEIVVEIKEKQ